MGNGGFNNCKMKTERELFFSILSYVYLSDVRSGYTGGRFGRFSGSL